MYQQLFHPTYLQSLCQQYNLSPSKKYGQNYLITEAPIKKMIEAADLKKTDTVIEIGPGFGVLTFALAEKVKKVVAFEIERKLEDYWEEKIKDLRFKIKDYGEIEIVWGNALKSVSVISDQLSKYQSKRSPINDHFVYKVVANIPYQITSELLRTLLELENKPESITIMIQKEVAERICAKPGDMSLLAISVQYYGEPKIIAKVPCGCFWPSPKVDSAVLYIKLKSYETTKLNENGKKCETTKKEFDQEFFRVVRAGFANKRKQLWGNLAKGLKINSEKVKNILIDVVGNEKVRAEELSVEQWREIVKKINT